MFNFIKESNINALLGLDIIITSILGDNFIYFYIYKKNIRLRFAEYILREL